MMLDEGDELPEDEEEILVYVEFDRSVTSNSFSNEKLQLDMIGLDTEHPIMQVNGKFYEGTYEDAVGTYMFFENDDDARVSDPVFDVKPTLKYITKTRKVLKMNRIFVELKTELFGDSNDLECAPSMETIKKFGIPPKYQEDALKSWEKMRNERIKALNDYLEKQSIRAENKLQGIEPDLASDDDNPFAIYKTQVNHKKTKRLDDSPNLSLDEKGKEEKARELVDGTSAVKERAFKLETIIATNDEPRTAKSNNDAVVDPERPSTSKDSIPWNSPPRKENFDENSSTSDNDEDAHHINLPKVKGMHKATVRVTRRVKTRSSRKLANNKKKTASVTSLRSSDLKTQSNSERANDADPSIIEKIILMEKSMKNHDNELIAEKSTRTLESLESLLISCDTEEFSMNMDVNASDNIKDIQSAIERKKLEKQRKRDEKMRHLANKLKKAADDLRLKSLQHSEDAP